MNRSILPRRFPPSPTSRRSFSLSPFSLASPSRPTADLGETVPLRPEDLPPPPPEPVAPVSVPVNASVRRPVGGFRGGLIGFLLGSSLVGGWGYFYLLDDYKTASADLLLSVEELKQSTSAMSAHIKRIENVEESVKDVKERMGERKEIEKMKKEYRRLNETQHLDLVELKAHVWGLEQDLLTLSQRGSNTVRI